MAAYEAYCKALPHTVSAAMLPWDRLPDFVQEAWRSAVVAAVDAPSRGPESLTDKQVRLLHEMNTASIARQVHDLVPPGCGFLLFVADYGQAGNLAYVASVDRNDAVRMVREWLARQGAF